jgi:hypothetical protein
VAPGDRAHMVPAVDATVAVGWCGLAQRARRGGGEEGRWETRERGRRTGAVAEPVVERSCGDA